MRVQHIQTLVAIADAGSLRGAADALGKSQPALTKALRQAEDDLGVPIFLRSSRGVFLTDVGERILARARTITSEVARLDDEVAQLRGEQVGSISVCVSPLAAVQLMPQALELFQRDYPAINIHLSSGMFPGALKPLRDGKIDLLVGPSPPIEMRREVKIEPLLETDIVIVTSSKSPYRKAKRLVELVDAPWIMMGSVNGPGDVFRDFFVEAGLEPPRATITSESYFGAMSLVETLGAICTFPLKLLESVRQGWEIEQIEIEEALAPRQVALITRAAHPLTPLGEKLANCIRRRAAALQHSDYQKLSRLPHGD